MYQTTYLKNYASGILEKRPIKAANKTQVINRPTGYNANFRPCIYYTPSLDDLDNPALKMKVTEHYQRAHDSDFRPYHVSPTGHEMDLKQHDIIPSKSGFTTMWEKAFLAKSSNQIKESQANDCPFSKLKAKRMINDPITKDNCGGTTYYIMDTNETSTNKPDMYVTENKARYIGKHRRWPSQSWRFHKSVGHKEPTATTRVEPYDPIEYLPRNPYRHDMTNSSYHNSMRFTGATEQQANFQKHRFHSDLRRENANGIPEPVPQSTRETGYSHETTKPRFTYKDHAKLAQTDVNTYLNPNRKDAYQCTLARYSFTAPATSNLSDISAKRVGRKEKSGYVWNHPTYRSRKETDRFTTHYSSVFSKDVQMSPRDTCNKATISLSSAGWPAFKASNGFTKSTRVHAH